MDEKGKRKFEIVDRSQSHDRQRFLSVTRIDFN